MGPQLQKAQVAALRANVALQALAGNPVRIYDEVAATPVFPYLTIGDEQVLDNGNACERGFEVFSDIHIWARDVNGHPIRGRAFAKEIGEHVIVALAAELEVDAYTTLVGLFETARYLTDPDGVTAHGVCTFRYLIEPE